MVNILASIIFGLCVNAGDKEQQIDCHEYYVNCLITLDGKITDKLIDRCVNEKNNNISKIK